MYMAYFPYFALIEPTHRLVTLGVGARVILPVGCADPVLFFDK